MSTATITSKGQITIPADVRRALSVEAFLEKYESEPNMAASSFRP